MTLAAIVLAAGSARRFGSDKLSARFRGEPLLRSAIRAARAAPVDRVIVVCAPALDIGDWPGTPPVGALRITSDALSTSLKAGVAAAGACDGAFVFLGDMPLVPPTLAARLADALGNHFAVVPRHAGRSGHPVLLSAKAFAAIDGLTGDAGAGRLLASRGDIVGVDCADDGIFLDVDRAEDLARLGSDAPGGRPPVS